MKRFLASNLPTFAILLVILFLAMLPNEYDSIVYPNTERVAARILAVDNDEVRSAGLIRHGEQLCEVELLQGRFKGQRAEGVNLLVGKLEVDKLFAPGDKAFVVVDYTTDGISHINIIDHYRLDVELILALLFLGALIVYARGIGVRAVLSFIMTVMMIWKAFLPLVLAGISPIPVALAVTMLLITGVILLVYGPDRRAMAAIVGSIGGTLVTCAMAMIFVRAFRIHGAVMAHSESLLYAGYENLNLTQIFTAAIFIASSGALMDLAVDITSAIHELMEKNPGLTRVEAIRSGLTIGRSVVGTMTTTLLLAYSGGYMALLMVFMAQGTPLLNILNLKYVAAEILHTMVGSVGLITVAPLTAIAAGWLLGRPKGAEAAVEMEKADAA